MTLSPKKFTSKISNSTANRGVEAKEIEIANTHLDLDESNCTQVVESSCGSRGDTPNTPHTTAGEDTPSQIASLPAADETGSYLQVVVQKHRRKREEQIAAAIQTSARVPTASSPLVKNGNQQGRGDAPAPLAEATGPAPGVYMLPHPMLLSYPALAPPAMQQYSSWPRPHVEAGTSARSSSSFKKLVQEVRGGPPTPATPRDVEAGLPVEKSNTKGSGFWKKITKITRDTLNPDDNVPERVEVFLFEGDSSEFLAASDGVPYSHGEQAAARAERVATRACAELLALPTCLLTLPVALLLQVVRAALGAARALVLGALAALGDQALKPALAVAFNALLHPPLSLLGRSLRALRSALRPLCALAGDALAPAERLVRAARLVHVEVHVAR